MFFYFFFFKQKTAYEMRISDWSSDVCSSDLAIMQTPIQSISRRPAARAAVMASAVMAIRYKASSMSGHRIQAFDLGFAQTQQNKAGQGNQDGNHIKARPAY